MLGELGQFNETYGPDFVLCSSFSCTCEVDPTLTVFRSEKDYEASDEHHLG
jgi:hypothetical protein